MTNVELIQAFAENPQISASSSYFRAFNGILFNRVPKDTNLSKTWYPVFICDDIGLEIHYSFFRLPTRSTWLVRNKISSIATRMRESGKTVVSADVKSEVPTKFHQPLKLRSVPNRKQFIRGIMKHYLSCTFPTGYSNYSLTGKLSAEEAGKEASSIAWEYALTTFADLYVKHKKTLEAQLNHLTNSGAVSKFAGQTSRLKDYVNNDNLTAAEPLLGEMGDDMQKIQSTLYGVKDEISRAAARCETICLYAPLDISDDIRDKKKLISGYFRNESILSIRNSNILKGWGDFASFLAKLGIDIPKPFGFALNSENISTLAAFRETSAESMVNLGAHFTRLVKEREEKAAGVAAASDKPKPSNLYLG